MALPTCPNCNEPLDPIVLPRGDTPPWNCSRCNRAWWDAELTATAKAAWNTHHRAFRRLEMELTIRPAIDNELAKARGWGLTFHPRHIPHISLERLEGILGELQEDTPQYARLEGLIRSKKGQQQAADRGPN